MTIFLSLIDELVQRGSLTRTIKSLSADEVSRVVDFLRPLVHNEKYAKITNFVLLKVLGNLLFNEENHEANVNLSESVLPLIKEVDR
jgi:hypothetical protein